MHPDLIRPHVFVALRIPSGSHSLHEVKPNTTISLGKYGSFQSVHLIGRPYHYTYEILDKVDEKTGSGLRIVPATELYADIGDDGVSSPVDLEQEKLDEEKGVRPQYEVVDAQGEILIRTNRNIVDDARSQTMTMEEIEMLKAEGRGSGKDLIAKILDSHSALDQKTTYALAKYTLRKTRKYLRRFTVLPVDVPLLTNWMLIDKDAAKTMEMREEVLALIGSWSNIHVTPPQHQDSLNGQNLQGQGRWLLVDDTGGLLVAKAAEQLAVLKPPDEEVSVPAASRHEGNLEAQSDPRPQTDHPQDQKPLTKKSKFEYAQSNTITLVHANSQPNLSLLHYFNFDAANPAPSHPLSRHLKTISWLQLLHPEDDNACTEPEIVPPQVLYAWKSGKRSNYHRKRRRWENTTFIVSDTHAGGFDGLMIASYMKATTILHHLVPLLRGAAQVVVYSPSLEPLVELADFYSTPRRVAFLNHPPPPESMPTEDFPVNPTLLLAPTIQTARCRPWQVLSGRTHPFMTSKGGAEGYVFVATRVLPAEGGVEARGISKKRKAQNANMTPDSRDSNDIKGIKVEDMETEVDMQ
ncbi:MAG: hypothetical protein Q9220_002939 [cf. Caloplaca sp. 1 TL-2023]